VVVRLKLYSVHIISSYNIHPMHACGIPDILSYFIHQLIRHKNAFIHSHNIELPWFTPSWATSTKIWLSIFYYSLKLPHVVRGYNISSPSFPLAPRSL
jgi:hypothetical protein